MIYKNDPTKKKTYLTRLILLEIFFLVVLVSFFLFMEKKFTPVNGSVFLALTLFYVIHTVRCFKKYDTGELEITDEELIIRNKKYLRTYKLADITRITYYSSFTYKNSFIAYFGNWSAVIVSCYIENFDEVKETIFKIKPIVPENGRGRKIIQILLLLPYFLLGISFGIHNVIAIAVTSLMGILSAIFSIYRNVKSSIAKFRKVVNCIAESMVIVALCYVSFIHFFISSDFAYRKNLDGEDVLMRKDTVTKYDKNGNTIYYSDGDCKYIYKYDDAGNEIFFKDVNDKYYENNYYEEDRLVKSVTSDGDVTVYKYDDRGNRIYYSINDGPGNWFEYNSDDKIVYSKDSDGTERKYEYDENGNLLRILILYSDGTEGEYINRYDSVGNKIYTKNENGLEIFSEYDDNNKVIYKKYGDSEFFYSYNSKGQCTYQKYIKQNSIIETETEYNLQGQESCSRRINITINEDGTEEVSRTESYYTYNKHGDMIRFQSPPSFDEEYSYDYDKDGRQLRSFSHSR